jgi:hypothetical protein
MVITVYFQVFLLWHSLGGNNQNPPAGDAEMMEYKRKTNYVKKISLPYQTKTPASVTGGGFNFWVIKWGLGGSGEFSFLLDYPGGPVKARPIQILFNKSSHNKAPLDSKIK